MVSAMVIMLYGIIKPFTYPHIFIPIVPQNVRDILDIPVPVLVGVILCNENNIIINNLINNKTNNKIVVYDVDSSLYKSKLFIPKIIKKDL